MVMEVNIKNHSDGKIVEVTDDLQLLVRAENHELQHYMARTHGQSYQVEYVDAGITAKTQALLHIKNVDPNRKMIFSYFRMQAITTTTFPSAADYFTLVINDTYVSGGTPLVPANTYQATGKVALAEVYGNDPVLGGAALVLDTRAPKDNGEECTYNKHGSIILGLNDTLTIKYTSTTAGWAKARCTFVMSGDF